jgi:pyruvate dehydrogenase E2 component (dihydrolipoamide acetyltransferase)
MEIDAGPTLALVERLRRESGVKVTITHVVGKAIATAFRDRPDLNGVIRRGRIHLRDTIDVFFQVAFEGGEDLSGVKVERADEKTIVEIAQELQSRAERIRRREDPVLAKTTALLGRLPAPLVGAAMRAISFATYDVGLDLSRFGIPFDGFGSVMVTNVGSFGVVHGYAPLVPFARSTALLTIGAVTDKPVARDGKVVVRPILTVGGTFDHRFIDGYQAGILSRRFTELLETPGAL